MMMRFFKKKGEKMKPLLVDKKIISEKLMEQRKYPQNYFRSFVI